MLKEMMNTMKNRFFKHLYFSKNINKKGEPMTLGVIIAIIILVILLVFIVFALTGSFGSLGDYNIFAGGSNIDAVVLGCNTACDGNFIDSWCKFREVRFAKTDSRNGAYACDELVVEGVLSSRPMGNKLSRPINPGNIQLVGIKPCSIQCG